MGRTVAELRDTVSADEFLWWNVYFRREAQQKEVAWKMAGG